jgi:hypothetical protein
MPIRQEGLPAFCRRSADQPYLVSPEKIFKQKKNIFIIIENFLNNILLSRKKIRMSGSCDQQIK